MAVDYKKKFVATIGVSPSSPTAIIGQVVRVNPNGVAYMRAPKAGGTLTVYCHRAPDEPSSTGLTGNLKATSGVRWYRTGIESPVNPDEKIVTFTFDKILNYSGQSAEQIGLKEGSVVEFEAPEGVVQSVKLM